MAPAVEELETQVGDDVQQEPETEAQSAPDLPDLSLESHLVAVVERGVGDKSEGGSSRRKCKLDCTLTAQAGQDKLVLRSQICDRERLRQLTSRYFMRT